jgi:hypothetical protein
MNTPFDNPQCSLHASDRRQPSTRPTDPPMRLRLPSSVNQGVNISTGATIRPAELRVFLAFVMLTLHPCQQAASHLACTRPPDFVASRCSFMVFPPASSSSSSRSATPARWALLAERSAAAPGLRATCILRAESSGGLLATSFGVLQHFHGPNILYGRPSSPA